MTFPVSNYYLMLRNLDNEYITRTTTMDRGKYIILDKRRETRFFVLLEKVPKVFTKQLANAVAANKLVQTDTAVGCLHLNRR